MPCQARRGGPCPPLPPPAHRQGAGSDHASAHPSRGWLRPSQCRRVPRAVRVRRLCPGDPAGGSGLGPVSCTAEGRWRSGIRVAVTAGQIRVARHIRVAVSAGAFHAFMSISSIYIYIYIYSSCAGRSVYARATGVLLAALTASEWQQQPRWPWQKDRRGHGGPKCPPRSVVKLLTTAVKTSSGGTKPPRPRQAKVSAKIPAAGRRPS